MGRCRNCHTHFWGNPHFCPSCKTDLWYEEYNDENWDFRALQEEGNRLIAKGNYEKAAVVLKLALDQVMYKHAQHSMHRLKDAVSDFVWLYSNEAADISDDRITDVLDYFEEECFGQPDKYRENLMQMRRDASRRLPQAQYREKQGLDFPHLRSYWEFAPVSQVTDQNSVSGYEPDILEAKHLLLTESFLYLYLNFSRVMKYLQAQDSLNTQMVTDELLPLLHPDLDMEKNGENDTAKLMENVLCGFLEDGFEELASLYLNHFDEAIVRRIFHVFEICFIYHRNDMIREFTDEFFDFCGVYISSGRVVWIADDHHFRFVCNGCKHCVEVITVIISQWENDTDTSVIADHIRESFISWSTVHHFVPIIDKYFTKHIDNRRGTGTDTDMIYGKTIEISQLFFEIDCIEILIHIAVEGSIRNCFFYLIRHTVWIFIIIHSCHILRGGSFLTCTTVALWFCFHAVS